MKNLVIAIDGPAGAGKSTISKKISEKLGINYIDTGAMYRAITYKCLKEKIDTLDEENVIKICENAQVDFKDNQIYLDGKCVNDEIRQQDVSANVSNVAKIARVREIMAKKQREIGLRSDVILDGRDIGTCIFPDSKYKFYLNASAEERGKRRYLELKEKGLDVVLDDIIKDIEKRDHIDSTRKVAPLSKAKDAIEIDSTNMTIDQVVEYVIEKVKES